MSQLLPNKICSKCSTEFSIINFSKSKKSKDGLHSNCKNCDKSRHVGIYASNKLRTSISIPESKLCNQCNKFKNRHDFSSSVTRKSGLNVYCKSCCVNRNAKFKQSVYESLGGSKCKNCGEAEVEFLTIQHIHGGGRLHRNQSNWKKLCKEILSDGDRTNKYEVLCANCNMVDSILKINLCMSNSVRSYSNHAYNERRKLSSYKAICNGNVHCMCCNKYNELNFLCIDHIVPWSIRPVGPRSGIKLYEWLTSNSLDDSEKVARKENLQVLCHNCNQSKGTGKLCAHKRRFLGLQYNTDSEDSTHELV